MHQAINIHMSRFSFYLKKNNYSLLYVHTRSELSDEIAGSHSLSMGKSDQSDQRYQRPKLSDQSVKKKFKTF